MIKTSLLSFVALVVLSATSASAQMIYENDFQHYTFDRLYTEDDLDADWYSPVWEDGVREERVALHVGPDRRGNETTSLAVLYPAGGYGTKRGGAQWILDLPESYSQVRLRYRVKFGEGFDFVRGGKLPGLAGGTAPTGSAPADGYNGWAARIMWRTDYRGTPGEVPQNTANLVQYVKHPTSGYNNDGRNEDNLYYERRGDRIKIESGRWYLITQLVKMNSVGRTNGRIKAWIDGKEVLDQRNLEFRYTNGLGIDKFYFTTFFGGGSSVWGPSKDEVIYFDDIDIDAR